MYKCKRDGKEGCETCKHAEKSVREEPCKTCVSKEMPCPMYKFYTGNAQCKGCMWEPEG